MTNNKYMHEKEKQYSYIEKNSIRTNQRIYKLALWSNILAPLLALGSWSGFFDIQYRTCLWIMVYALTMSFLLRWLNRRPQWYKATQYISLIMMELLIGMMFTNAAIGALIALGLIPVLSCMYVNLRFTRWIDFISYIVLAVALYFRSIDQLTRFTSVYTQREWFLNNLLGYSIEFFFVFLITTSLVKYERELLIEEEKMIRKQQKTEQEIQMKTEFFSRISHGIRTPMNAICGLSDLLAKEELSEESADYVETIRSSGRDLQTIINSVLDISKMQLGKMQKIERAYNPRTEFKDVLHIAEFSVTGKEVQLNLKVEDTVPQLLYGDMDHIRQILLNLLNNALKFTDDGEILLSVGWKQKEEILLLQIKDTGCGIKEEDQLRVFEAFEQTRDAAMIQQQGTGLGLTICKALAEWLGGSIRLESTYGKGSTFYVEIPQKLYQGKDQLILEADEKTEENHKGTIESHNTVNRKDFTIKFCAPDARILIVDDNRVNLKVEAELMKDYGFKISSCLSGIYALQMLESGMKFDIVFMDHLMPEIDGMEVTRRIRKMSDPEVFDVPIIALSANVVENMEEQFMEAGMNAVLAKPIDREKLDAILTSYIPKEKQKVKK